MQDLWERRQIINKPPLKLMASAVSFFMLPKATGVLNLMEGYNA